MLPIVISMDRNIVSVAPVFNSKITIRLLPAKSCPFSEVGLM